MEKYEPVATVNLTSDPDWDDFQPETVVFEDEVVTIIPEQEEIEPVLDNEREQMKSSTPRWDPSEFPFPEPSEFLTENGKHQFIRDSYNLERLIERVIAKFDRFDHLKKLNIQGWYQKGETKDAGRTVLAKISKPSGILKEATNADLIITVSYTAVVARELNYGQMEALIFHELCHVDVRKGKIGMRGHDAEMFLAEIAEYGLWRNDIRATKQVIDDGKFRQLSAIALENISL